MSNPAQVAAAVAWALLLPTAALSEEAPPSCRKGLPVETLVQEAARRRVSPDSRTDPLVMNLVGYYRCQAFVKQDISLCDPLKALGKDANRMFRGAYEFCVGSYFETNMFHDLITRSPGGQASCEIMMKNDSVDPKRSDTSNIPAVCAAFVNRTDDAAATCKRIRPYMETLNEIPRCKAIVNMLNGREKCATSQVCEQVKPLCPDFVAFHRAFAAQDPELCGDRVYCRVLLGGGADGCRYWADQANRAYCQLDAQDGGAPSQAL